VLRGVSGPEGDAVTGGWRKMHCEELRCLYCLMTKSRKFRWAGYVACVRR
jgi:hypothetical protein